MKKVIFILSTLCIFIIFNYSIYQKEQIKKYGEIVYLKLRPADPRSLMQGDYMHLSYEIENEMNKVSKEGRGKVVISLDEHRVGIFARFHQGEQLAANEKLLSYEGAKHRLSIIPNSFMFEEGRASFYNQAKYGILKFYNEDDYILIGLADEQLQTIDPQNK